MSSKVGASGSAANASASATTPIGTEEVQRNQGRPPPWLRSSHKHFGAAAADVDQQHVLGGGIDQRQAAQQREPRLVLVRQDLEREAGDPPDPLEELDAVAGAAAGLGGDAAEPTDLVAADDPGADPQRCDRARDRPLAQPSAARRPPRPAARCARSCRRPGKPGPRPRDQQPAVVGAEVERGQCRRNAAAGARNREAVEAGSWDDGRTVGGPAFAHDFGHPLSGGADSALPRSKDWA